jgi:very-short-patch-repair endonuclease
VRAKSSSQRREICTTDPFDAQIAARAARQHRNIHRRQLVAIGVSDHAIRGRLRRGNLYRVFWGVYSVGAPARTPAERAAAAVLACGERSTLGLCSALAHWGLIKYWPRRPQVLTAKRRKIKGIDIRRCSDLRRSEVTTHDGITTTTVARSLLDAAPGLPAKQLDRAVTTALLNRLTTTAQLEAICEKHPDHPGAALLEPFWNTSDGPARSDWERDAREFRRRGGFDGMIINADINGREADAYFAEERVILEFDGWITHRSPLRFEADRERDADNLDNDIVTIRITEERYRADIDREIDRVHRILARRRDYLELLSRA